MYTDLELEKLADFYIKHRAEYRPAWSDKNILSFLELHKKYDTLLAIFDKKGEPIAVSRFNIIGDTAEILDVVVDKKYRKQQYLKTLTTIGYLKYPFLKFLRFEDDRKPDSPETTIPIEQQLLDKAYENTIS